MMHSREFYGLDQIRSDQIRSDGLMRAKTRPERVETASQAEKAPAQPRGTNPSTESHMDRKILPIDITKIVQYAVIAVEPGRELAKLSPLQTQHSVKLCRFITSYSSLQNCIMFR